MYIINTHEMSTLGKKDVRINLKLKSLLREEFQAASHLRGASMSSLLHQHIVKIVREEKERNPEEFARALEFVRKVGADEEGNKVYGEAQMNNKLPGDLAEVEMPEGEDVPATDTPEKVNEQGKGEKGKGKTESAPKRRSNGK